MEGTLQQVFDLVQQNSNLSVEEKSMILAALDKVKQKISVTEFKLDRTEKVKWTTEILLEETINELEEKRKAVEDANSALQKSLDELKTTQAQLIHSEKMASLGELTAGIAHEIKNPLNFVNNFSELSNELFEEMEEALIKGDLAEVRELAGDIGQNLVKIQTHGKRADSIVRSMLQHSRRGGSEKELTDLNALVDEYLRLAYHGLRAKDAAFNAGFEAKLDEHLPAIEVIPQEIGRVILNLLNNAFYAVTQKRKETDENYRPMVIVSTVKQNGNVKITVKDNGNGMPPEIAEKIFQPFFTTKPTGEGTGLGLSLSYDIIRAHGGEMKVATNEGTGSEFIIELPIADEPAMRD